MSTGKIFRGGVPTEPDVKKLLEAFPVDKMTTVKHEEVEDLLQLDRFSNRYRTVTNAWRKYLIVHERRVIEVASGIGFKLLEGKDTIQGGFKCLVSVGRKARHGLAKMLTVNDSDMSEHDKARARIGQHALLSIHNETCTARKERALLDKHADALKPRPTDLKLYSLDSAM